MHFIEFYKSVVENKYQTIEKLPFSTQKILFNKGDVITDYNQTEKHVYFINSGIVELVIKSYMTEKIIDFFFTNEMVCALTSFLTQTPSDIKLTALTDCEMERIEHDALMEAYANSIDVNQFGRIITEQAYIRKSNREKDFLSKTAEERYLQMFESHRNYLHQIPVNKIARYLGIHPESLSRIRSKLNS
ncbi:MAG: Crp/Fnr family transcriptional regulator [Winogradskyella sp.]|uniref:Crp/Fnr family transcriptional regulator n=1 Tax=Winogradskyella sp. TaxID=1883156 RepID=UPI000F41A560|nr:Crp/Fnr family transcriptional regulator [Winogradskyella sp.]RNC87202.1 MAG: Crp/Fnr family transcriptional regulator [Winogradskyella sp.]